MSAPRCIGEPVSWLALERLRLGELGADERRAVEQHLAACAACAACVAEIEQPLRMPALPATPATFWARLLTSIGRARVWAPVGVAILVGMILFARPKPHDEMLADGTMVGIKGGGVALSLVRERDGSTNLDATTFSAHDRWKVLVTCPAARVVFWDVAVVDGASVAYPLAPGAPIACGNRVPLPGAFRLDGERPVEVCLLLGTDPVERTARPADRKVCATLRPER